jgi:ribosome assembly protein RRB1
MSSSKKRTAKTEASKEKAAAEEPDSEALEYEDPFGDDFEEEELEDHGDYEEGENVLNGDGVLEMDGEGTEKDEEKEGTVRRAFRPGVDELAEGEELVYDPSAYNMYHSLRTEWPCLSFDICRDNLGESRVRYPHSIFIVTGS